jgi:uncharacterized protein HemX
MTRRLAVLTTLLVLALAVPASAQQNPFGPLPPAAPTPTATPTAVPTTSDDSTGRNVLFIIGGALIIGFGVMGYLIMRDARKAVPDEELSHQVNRDEAWHQRQKQLKAKARKRTRAQKQARKAQRNR